MKRHEGGRNLRAAGVVQANENCAAAVEQQARRSEQGRYRRWGGRVGSVVTTASVEYNARQKWRAASIVHTPGQAACPVVVPEWSAHAHLR